MSLQNRNWEKARIATKIYFVGADGEYIEHECSLVNRVSVRQVNNFQPIHGLNQWNQGVKELPPDYTFTIAVYSNSDTARLLRALHAAGTPFNLQLSDATDSGEFALKKEIMIECRFTTREVTIEVGDIPMSVLNGMALRYSYDDGEDMDASGNGLPIPEKMFGSGLPVDDTVVDLFKEWTTG